MRWKTTHWCYLFVLTIVTIQWKISMRLGTTFQSLADHLIVHLHCKSSHHQENTNTDQARSHLLATAKESSDHLSQYNYDILIWYFPSDLFLVSHAIKQLYWHTFEHFRGRKIGEDRKMNRMTHLLDIKPFWLTLTLSLKKHFSPMSY